MSESRTDYISASQYTVMRNSTSLHRHCLLSYAACLALIALIASCSGKSTTPIERIIKNAPLVPFDELFALEDTVVLDPSVILGPIWDIDADPAGYMLIMDMSAELVYLFEPEGRHVTTFDKDVCFPNDSGHFVHGARLADNGTVLVSTLEGTMVVFDRYGECLEARADLTSPLLSFCTWDDSLYTFLALTGPERNQQIVEVYSMDLVIQRSLELTPPRFPRLNSNHLGISGRNMDCFQGGPLYKYHEDMDATAVAHQELTTKARPDFFVPRDEDIPDTRDRIARTKARNAFQSLSGLYALNQDVRLMAFFNIREEYHPEGTSSRFVSGYSIASNSDRFSPVSTIPYKAPISARHGHLYFIGPSLPLPDGDVGNSSIIRYRFLPPTDS